MANKSQLRWIWVLALAGYIPFMTLAVLSFLGLDLPLPLRLTTYFLIWSLAILTFLGGIRWGIALTQAPIDTRLITLSIVPCIIGWFAIFMPEGVAVLVLGILFALHGVWDVISLRKSDLSWFAPVRLTLTVLVCLAHGLVLSIFL